MTSKTHSNSADDKAMHLLSMMTLKEKFQALTSPGFRRMYSTKPMKKLGIPSFRMTDGPLGLAYHSNGFKKCTRFPATIALAATWNRNLAREMGIAMAEEARAIRRHMILAPGINLPRTPLNGRTFEYFSEEPHLTKELAIPLVQGMQSQGIGACIKHYAVNNQEIDRRSSSSEVDERTLHEVYLRAFRDVVQEADPYAVMGSYNKINGVYGCENRYLLREILMDTWGFKGFVVSDWFATRPIRTAAGCINAGLSLEMPIPSKYKQKKLMQEFEEGRFTEETLDDLVYRLLRVMNLTGVFEGPSQLPKGSLNTEQHQTLSRRIAEEGMVLLKNQGNLLPLNLDEIETIVLLGPNLNRRFGRILYGGSSAVKPPYEITPLEGIGQKVKGRATIIKDVSKADIAIIFVGLNHDKGNDSETYDRSDITLPTEQEELINSTSKANPNTIVVIIAGSPIGMEGWIENVPAVLDAWYAGMESGRAIANVLFGDSHPAGRLPITFPKRLRDSPAHSTMDSRNYPGDEDKKVHYDEGLSVGYRWFDQKDLGPLFPFGFGLGYSTFELGTVEASAERFASKNDTITINVEVENIGSSWGTEVVQIYAHHMQSSVERPPKELVGFQKVMMNANERRTVPIIVKSRDLMYYDVSQHDWQLEPGNYELLIGSSSRDIHSKIDMRI